MKILLLCVFVWAGAVFAMGAPRIDGITHNGFGILMPGDTLSVVLNGSSGGVATFDISTVVKGVPMQETSQGVYQGHYTIQQNETRVVPFASVAGHLALYGRSATLVAMKAVSIGTNVAQINPALQLYPAPGFQSTSTRPQIKVVFQNPIQPSTVYLIVDGVDDTSQVQSTPNSVEWSPSNNLSNGEHHVVLWAVDTQGQQLRREWNFYVGNETSNNDLIQSVTESPRTISPGQAVTVTMNAAPGGTAVMSVEKDQDISMMEGPSGIYTGSYSVPSRLQGHYAYLTVKLQTPDGRMETLNDADVVYVTKGMLPLNISGPFGGSQVPQAFDVTGTTQPNASVRVRLWGPDNSGAWHEILNDQTHADYNGNYSIHIDSGSLPSGSKMTLFVQAQGAQGSQSGELRIELTRQ